MAKIFMIMTVYFLFASISGVFKFLKWKRAERASGVPVSMSEPEAARGMMSGGKVIYTFDVELNRDGKTERFRYIEKIDKDGEHGVQLNEETEFLLDTVNSTVIPVRDLEILKKKLYTNPLACLGCAAASAVLLFIAASIH